MSKAFYATVHNGGLVLDEPIQGLPEGKRVQLLLVDDDEMSDEEREKLHAAIDKSRAQFANGQFVTPEEMFANAKARHK
jgi:hypothetical protein